MSRPPPSVPPEVAAHVAAFDAAVVGGDWTAFADRFSDDAEMAFVGVPAGPFNGRAAVAAAYAADPPAEGLDVVGDVAADGPDLVVPFRWRESGGTGTMRLRFGDDGLVERLVVAFD